MKKIFFFLILLLPNIVYASSIKDLKVLNGELSRKFESNNNIYSVILNENENSLKLDYELIDENAEVIIEEKEDTTILKITNTDNTKEEYVFYLEKEESIPVFKETEIKETKKEIPYLIYYVSITCIVIILVLFKVLILHN